MYLKLVTDGVTYRVDRPQDQPKLTKKLAKKAAYDALDELNFVNYVLIYNDRNDLVETVHRP